MRRTRRRSATCAVITALATLALPTPALKAQTPETGLTVTVSGMLWTDRAICYPAGALEPCNESSEVGYSVQVPGPQWGPPEICHAVGMFESVLIPPTTASLQTGHNCDLELNGVLTAALAGSNPSCALNHGESAGTNTITVHSTAGTFTRSQQHSWITSAGHVLPVVGRIDDDDVDEAPDESDHLLVGILHARPYFIDTDTGYVGSPFACFVSTVGFQLAGVLSISDQPTPPPATDLTFTTPVVQGPVGSTVPATFEATNSDGSPFVGTVRYGVGSSQDGVPAQTQSLTLLASNGGQGSIPVTITSVAQTVAAYADDGTNGFVGARDATEVLGVAEAIGASVATPPGAPTLVAPGPGAQFASGAPQVFTVNATDPDADATADDNDYRGIVTVRSGDGSVAAVFPTSSGDSGENVSGSPVEPLSAGSYTWTARAVDEQGNAGVESASGSFAVAGSGGGAPSTRCDDGTKVIAGTLLGQTPAAIDHKVYTKQSGDETWICVRVDGPAVHAGGRLRAAGSAPVVDTNDAFCATQAGNVTQIDTNVGPQSTPVRVDHFANASGAGVCVHVGDVHVRASARTGGGGTGFDADP